MIKSLFFDIDGTLVSFKTHRIPDSTVMALEEANRRGVKIFISTGRPKAFVINLKQ
ncbi:MAG: HAD hydrolase family protein, partial [Bacteroidales bacterium]|nr:HAD hydrolase family protein [Bacteroidales bacterium]